MKKTLITILLILFPAFAYAVIPLQSSQIGTNPTNGYVIQTNGATSTWVSTSSLGISGGGGSGTVTSITFSSPLTGGTITNSGTVTCPTTSGSQSGCLSSTDWTTFNGKLSGNQSITLSGDVSGSGATSITTAIGAGKITTAMLSNLISLPLASTTGTLTIANGGTGQTAFSQGWINSNGTSLSASTSPTVNYIVATSTATASQFVNASTTYISSATASTTGENVSSLGGNPAGTIVAADPSGHLIATTTPSASLSGGSTNTFAYWISATGLGATSSPTVGYITATSSTASTFPNASTTNFSSKGSTDLATAGGNVGINTAAPAFALDVKLGDNGSVRYQTGTGANAFVVTAFGNYLNCANQYYNSGWIREQSSPAACVQVEGNTGNIDFTSDASGSAGSFSPTTVFTFVNSTGNFGFGTTSPYAKLSVVSGSGTGVAFAVSTTTGKDIDGYDNDGHTFTAGPPPVISTCGTGTGTVVGDDQSGTITTATAATACTLTFAKAYFKTPVCTVTDNSLVGFADISSVSTTAVTFGISSALTGGLLFYQCEYHRTP